jgi:anti-anti-sigma regulatory factor
MRKKPGQTIVKLEGVFDVPSARRVEALIERASAGDTVLIDLSLVREFHDFAIAILAQALKHAGPVRVAIQGLRQHQARVLRYFGVEAARFEQQQAPSAGA